MVKKVAILTADGFVPCLPLAIGGLAQRYTETAPEVEITTYKRGYQGLLQGSYFIVDEAVRAKIYLLHMFDGPPVRNSRVKLTNVKDLVKCGLVAEGTDLLKVAIDCLVADGVDVLHTIGDDDINTTAADLATFLAINDYPLTAAGLSKTIDNDVIPIRQSPGVWTAVEQEVTFAKNTVAKHNSGSRMPIVYRVMGYHYGWLTTATAAEYRKWLDAQGWLPGVGLSHEAQDVHTVYVPEAVIDIVAEAERLGKVMDEAGSVTIFLSESAGLDSIVAEMEAAGEEALRDPFGHVKFDKVNLGKWLGGKFAGKLGAEKVMIQKLSYFSRSAAANEADLVLVKWCTDLAVNCTLTGRSGVIGQDEENNDELTAVTLERIKGGKLPDIIPPWFTELVAAIGQPAPVAAATH